MTADKKTEAVAQKPKYLTFGITQLYEMLHKVYSSAVWLFGHFCSKGPKLITLFELLAIHRCGFHPNNISKSTSINIERSNEKTIMSHRLSNLDEISRLFLSNLPTPIPNYYG